MGASGGRALLLGLMALGLSACAPRVMLHPGHSLIFDGDGRPVRIKNQVLAKRSPVDPMQLPAGYTEDQTYDVGFTADDFEELTPPTAAEPGEYDRNIVEIFNQFLKWNAVRGDNTLAIFLHGGLDDYPDSLGATDGLMTRGILRDEYLVSIDWSAGLSQALLDHYFSVKKGKRSNLKDCDCWTYGSGLLDLSFDVGKSLAEVADSFGTQAVSIADSYPSFNDVLGDKTQSSVLSLQQSWITDWDYALSSTAKASAGHPLRPELQYFPDGMRSRLSGGYGRDEGFWAHAGRSLLDGIYLPGEVLGLAILREPGYGSYLMMQRHLHQVFDSDQADFGYHYYHSLSGTVIGDVSRLGGGAMGVFLRDLIEFQRLFEADRLKGPGDQNSGQLKIRIYAHSMGTMVADEMIRRLNGLNINVSYTAIPILIRDPKVSPTMTAQLKTVMGPLLSGGRETQGPELQALGKAVYPVAAAVAEGGSLDIDRITYLAGADSIRHWRQTVMPYLADHPETTYNNVMLNYMSELREQNFILFPLWAFPKGSLLVWIDNYLSEEKDRFDRTLGRAENTLFYSDSLPWGIRRQVRFISFDQRSPNCPDDPGVNCDSPQTHGQVFKWPFWKDESYAVFSDDLDPAHAIIDAPVIHVRDSRQEEKGAQP